MPYRSPPWATPPQSKIKQAHGLIPDLCVDRRRVSRDPRPIRRPLAHVAARRDAERFWKHSPVSGTAAGECRTLAERGHAALAPQRFLDADRDVVLAVDDRPVSMDVLRSLPA